MIVEHNNTTYETIMDNNISKGELYFDCVENIVKKCEDEKCFLPWGLKLKKIENEKNQFNNWCYSTCEL